MGRLVGWSGTHAAAGPPQWAAGAGYSHGLGPHCAEGRRNPVACTASCNDSRQSEAPQGRCYLGSRPPGSAQRQSSKDLDTQRLEVRERGMAGVGVCDGTPIAWRFGICLSKTCCLVADLFIYLYNIFIQGIYSKIYISSSIHPC